MASSGDSQLARSGASEAEERELTLCTYLDDKLPKDHPFQKKNVIDKPMVAMWLHGLFRAGEFTEGLELRVLYWLALQLRARQPAGNLPMSITELFTREASPSISSNFNDQNIPLTRESTIVIIEVQRFADLNLSMLNDRNEMTLMKFAQPNNLGFDLALHYWMGDERHFICVEVKSQEKLKGSSVTLKDPLLPKYEKFQKQIAALSKCLSHYDVFVGIRLCNQRRQDSV